MMGDFFGLKMEWFMMALFILTVGFIGISTGLKCLVCDSKVDNDCINPKANGSSEKFSKECGPADAKIPMQFDQLMELFPVFEQVLKDIMGPELWKKLEPLFKQAKALLLKLIQGIGLTTTGGNEPMCMMASSENGTVRGCSEDLPKPPKGRASSADKCKDDKEKKNKGCACSEPGCNDQSIGQKITYTWSTLGMSIVIGLVAYLHI